MNKKTIIIIGVFFLIISLVIGYFLLNKKSSNNTLLVESEQLNLVEGTNYTIKALTYPETSLIQYKSSDETVTTIDSDGNIEALKEGTALITVSSLKLTKQVNVTVTKEEVAVTGLELKEIKGIQVGEKYLLSLILYPNNATITDVLWIVSDESILKINDGYIEGLQKGNVQVTAQITVDDKVISDSITVKVGEEENVKLKSLSFDEEVITVGLNETYALNPIIEPSNTSDKNIIYKIQNPNIIEINNGIIKALAKGETSVTASSNGKEVDLIVKVKSGDGIVLNIEEISIAKGETYQLKSNFISGIEWYSNNNKVATVDNGLVRGINDGEATITVINSYGRMNTVKVKVAGNGIVVESLNINNDEITVQTGKSYKLNVEIIPNNATNKEVIYETSDSRIATVDDNGLVMGKAEGTCIITAYSSNNKSVNIRVTVTQGKVSLDSLDINPSAVVLSKGDSYQLYASFIPSNVSDTSVFWSSNDSSIVSVNNGLIKALKTGTTTVSATSNGITSNIEVSVRESIIAITNVDIKSSNFTLSLGQTKKLEVSYLPSNASNKNFSWTSSDSSVASVSSKGVVTGIKSGKATITCTSINGKKDSVVVEVIKQSEGEITSIIISSENINLQKGETKQIRATILPLTSSQEVTWISNDENIVKVNNGLLTAITPGITTIAAIAKNGMIAKATIIVSYPPIYSNGSKELELVSDTLIVTMTTSNTRKVIRVWVANPYKQFHKVDVIGNEKVGDILNRAIGESNLKNSILIGSNASVNKGTMKHIGNLIITNGVSILNNPGGPTNTGNNGNRVIYYGIGIDGILRVYDPIKNTTDNERALFSKIINDGVLNTIGITYENYLVENAKVRRADGYTTAIRNTLCQVNTNNFIFIVSTNGDKNLELAQDQIREGCITGVNLDGGGSTNVFYKNKGDNTVKPIYSTTRTRPEAIYFSEY